MPLASTWGVMEVLSSIERQLTAAAELHFMGSMNEELYISTLRGTLAGLPMLEAPRHIAVLKHLKQWKDDELIPLRVYEQLCPAVMAASRGPTAEAGSSGSSSAMLSAPAPAVAKRSLPGDADSSSRPIKQAKVVQGQQTLFNVLPAGTTKTKVAAHELKKQREAALRGEDYEVEEEELLRFQKEKTPPPQPVVKEYRCPKCPRTFSTALGLTMHSRWHSDDTQPKEFFNPQPEVPPTPVEIGFTVNEDGDVAVSLSLNGLTLQQIKAQEAEWSAKQEERKRQLDAEAHRRQRLREAEANADAGEHRRGSQRRRQYPPKDKLQILEVFDKIRADPTITRKVEAFENDPRSRGTPYTTVKVGWDPPKERAKISAAAGREHAGTLLRIDKKSRKTGRFAAMEANLFSAFKARRARGRKVSGRWLTAMGRQFMQKLYPGQAASFKGGKSWRRRFAIRYKIGIRRKTNGKNKTWADTEPVLMRYLRALRKRLQLNDDGEELTPPESGGEEPEPEDVNPAREDEDEEQGAEEAPLDSEDEGEDDDVLVTLAQAMPSGYTVGPPPPSEVLEYKGAQAGELVERIILFNWAGVGWSEGHITRANTDGRIKMKVGETMVTANFFVFYTSDEHEAKHCLSLDTYGIGELREDGRWVLLVKEAEA
jgi:hypothetical protein